MPGDLLHTHSSRTSASNPPPSDPLQEHLAPRLDGLSLTVGERRGKAGGYCVSQDRRGEERRREDDTLWIVCVCECNLHVHERFFLLLLLQDLSAFQSKTRAELVATSEVGLQAGSSCTPTTPLPSASHVPSTSRVTMSARPVGLQVSGPAAWDKATINCRAVQRARGTKGPTRCPCPQTRPETNVTGLAQKGIIRPVSLNTFTYLRALSAPCFVLAQEEGRA